MLAVEMMAVAGHVLDPSPAQRQGRAHVRALLQGQDQGHALARDPNRGLSRDLAHDLSAQPNLEAAVDPVLSQAPDRGLIQDPVLARDLVLTADRAPVLAVAA